MRKLSVLFSLFAFLMIAPADAKNADKDNGKQKAKNEWRKTDKDEDRERKRDTDRERNRREDYRYEDEDLAGWARRTEGHRPHDRNGDGLITRNEWPGNDVSFRRLDRNGDGVISKYDRSLAPTTSNVHGERGRRR
jgi:hypothetical protein